jgi:hypothetical protein
MTRNPNGGADPVRSSAARTVLARSPERSHRRAFRGFPQSGGIGILRPSAVRRAFLRGLACLLIPAAGAACGETRLQALVVLDLTNQGGLPDSTEGAALSGRFRSEMTRTGLWDVVDHSTAQKCLRDRGAWPVFMLQRLRAGLPLCPPPSDSAIVAFAEARKVDRLYTLTGTLIRWKDGAVIRVESEDAVCPFDRLLAVHVRRLARSLSGLEAVEPVPEDAIESSGRERLFSAGDDDSTAAVTVISDPAGLAFAVDGVPFGVTPATAAGLGRGWHRLRLSGEHYSDWIESFRLKPGASDTLRITPYPVTGSLFVESEIPISMIRVDGRYSGYTPRAITNLAPGRHRLEVSAPRTKAFTADVEIIGARTARILAVQTRASLQVVGEVEGAVLRLNGKSVKTGTADTMAVRPGDYKLVARRKGYETIRIPLSIEPLEREKIVLRFNARSRGKAVARSFVLPGWGQLYAERSFRGFLTLFSEAALIGGAIAADRRMGSFAEYRAAVTMDEIALTRDRMTRRYDGIRDSESARDAFLAAAAGVWIAGIVDALWFHPPVADRRFGTAGFRTSVAVCSGGARIGFTFDPAPAR